MVSTISCSEIGRNLFVAYYWIMQAREMRLLNSRLGYHNSESSALFYLRLCSSIWPYFQWDVVLFTLLEGDVDHIWGVLFSPEWRLALPCWSVFWQLAEGFAILFTCILFQSRCKVHLPGWVNSRPWQRLLVDLARLVLWMLFLGWWWHRLNLWLSRQGSYICHLHALLWSMKKNREGVAHFTKGFLATIPRRFQEHWS